MSDAMSKVIIEMAEAIKAFEGWHEGVSKSWQNNNPGNLKYHGQPGAIDRDEQGHAIFDTYPNGWLALLNQVRSMFTGTSRIYNPGMTLNEVFYRYAEANSKEYAQFVANRLGVTPDTQLNQIV